MMALFRLCRPRMTVPSSSALQHLSTAASEQQQMATDNDVNMTMDDDEPETGYRSIMTMKKNIRVSPNEILSEIWTGSFLRLHNHTGKPIASGAVAAAGAVDTLLSVG